MKLEIYVVKPYKDITYLSFEETEAIKALEQLKVELCEEFGGLTESAPAKGYWLDNGRLVKDDVTVWTIYSSTVITPQKVLKFAERIKVACSQKSQLITINDKPFFV